MAPLEQEGVMLLLQMPTSCLNFLPSFTSPGNAGNANFLQALTQAMPSLRNIPAMNNFIPKGTQRSTLFDSNNPQ